MTLAAPIPKTFAARSETVLNALVATENKPHVAQGSSSFPLAQQLQRKFIEEQPLHPLQPIVHLSHAPNINLREKKTLAIHSLT
ncbi:hypothetical protein LENED_004076 [Lentinula edodes]|uniref:Uncharacterized protein n=1 Tax=Lentinula edodes TaxID=5353 RepID=A0A1Q3E5H9_LENED|nr:hypothetical protein LENED_004076 [Lentinula edodes]